jgi:hypothetical protein
MSALRDWIEFVYPTSIGGVLGIVFAVWGIRFLMLLLLNGRGDQPFALAVVVNCEFWVSWRRYQC